ncbi:hypothetical protein WMY93_029614 [Mugilogobius chulae]|uniref:Translocon-associated protein subunit alpha n=1 Tax=Mugilogobius chulae TaxID=88201 RepID=A0AAW0MLJ9_9GOBI
MMAEQIQLWPHNKKVADFDCTDDDLNADENTVTHFNPKKLPLSKNTLYRFRCPGSGAFRCSSTGLVFVVSKEAELQYRTVQWDEALLESSGRTPAGPLYDIECPEQALFELHLPHCEPEHAHVSESLLSVAHFSGRDTDFIEPLRISNTHVIIKVSKLSQFGLTSPPEENKTISGQILLFRTPKKTWKKEIKVNLFLLPRNIPVDEVSCRQSCTTEYIDVPPKCKLVVGRYYSVVCPNAEVQPERALFDMDHEPNFHPSFELRLSGKSCRTFITVTEDGSSENQTVWRHNLCLTDPSCKISRTNKRRFVLEKLEKARPRFVKNVSGPILDQLLDKLLAQKYLISEEMEQTENFGASRRRYCSFVTQTPPNKTPQKISAHARPYSSGSAQSAARSKKSTENALKMWGFLPKLLLLVLLAFPATLLVRDPLVSAQDLTEDEEAEAVDEDVVDDVTDDAAADDEDDEAEVEDDENAELVEDKEDEEEEALVGEMKASPNADTTILFVKGEDFPANDIVKFLLGFTNKGTENFVVESLDASFRYPQVSAVQCTCLKTSGSVYKPCSNLPRAFQSLITCLVFQDYQFFIQNFTALQLGIVVPPSRQATFEYSFIPAEPMGGRPFGLVVNLNYKDTNGNVFQDAVFNQTVTITEKEDGLDGETIFMYVFLSGLGLLVVVGLHQLLESRKRRRPAAKVEMGTSSHNDVDLSWIPQETLNQIMQSRRDKASPRRSPRKRNQKRSAGSDE